MGGTRPHALLFYMGGTRPHALFYFRMVLN